MMDATVTKNKGLIDQELNKYSLKENTKSKLRKMGLIPNNPLCLFKADVCEVQRRYKQMYIPSSFYEAHIRWVEDFPINDPLHLDKPCSFHIMDKNVEPLMENEESSKVSDADYSYSAKVMLISIPAIDDIYRKCCSVMPDNLCAQNNDERVLYHLSTQLHFLTGINGAVKMPIGGPWSPKLDGPDPENNPSVLIRTAIRTCRSLTGINLASCRTWLRFVEVCYRREETTKKGRVIPSKIEKVVIFLPDIWNCVPNDLEYNELRNLYITSLCMEELDSILKADQNLREDSISPIKQETQDNCIFEYNLNDLNVTDFQKSSKISVTQEFDESTALNANNLNSNDIFNSICGSMKSADGIEREELEKLYSLPETPRIIIHPSRDANSGNFNCALLPLSDLLGYSFDERTEYSFEVSLFAELFNEMLMRDFGFNIYNWLCKLSENEDNVADTVVHHNDKEKDTFTKECSNLVTSNPYLLLSFEYFDLLHYGYMSEKEIKGLIHSLGLNLSRAQVRKLFLRAGIKDCLYYRKLICTPRNRYKTVSELLSIIQKNTLDNDKDMADNNKNMPTIEKPIYKRQLSDESELSPVYKKLKLTSDTGLMMCHDESQNIEKLTPQLENGEEALEITQKRLVELERKIVTLSNSNIHAQDNIKELTELISDYKIKLCHSKDAMRIAMEKCYKYHFALQEIHAIIKKLKRQRDFQKQLQRN